MNHVQFYPSLSNKDMIVLPIIRTSVGDIISCIDIASIACLGKSQYRNGNVNHSFQLKRNFSG